MAVGNDPVFRKSFRDTLPVLAGYMVLGVGFGLLMRSAGYGFVWTLMMSLFIFAGSMQYLAVSLFAGGASLLTCALMTLMVNARHLFYGISMSDSYRNMGKCKPYLIFALTDETYSLVCRQIDVPPEKRERYCLYVTVLDHLYWVTGSCLGSLLSRVLPFDTRGVEFALTAMFIVIFTDQWLKKENRLSAVLGIFATALCLAVFGKDGFLIPTMILITALLLFAGSSGKGETQK